MEQKNNYSTRIFTIPNILSFFRICLIPGIVMLYSSGQFLAAGWILILSGVTDIVDGFIARHFHMISDLGKVLDPIADKLTQAATLICLLLEYPLMLLPFILLAVKELFMTVTGVLVIRRTGQVLGASWHGKAATCLLYAMMMLHIFWPGVPAGVSAASIVACAVMIGISFILYARRNLRLLRTAA